MSTKNLHLLMTAKAQGVDAAFDKTSQGLDKLKAKADAVGKSKGDLLGGLTGSLGGLGGLLTGGAAIGGATVFAAKIRSTQESIEQQGQDALKTGSSIKGYSGLMFAAGGQADAAAASIQKLSETIGNATLGNAEARASYQELGLDYERLASMKTDQAFLEVAEALNKQGNAATRNSLAIKTMGEQSLQAMKLIGKGRAEIERLAKVGESQGKVVSGEDVAAVQMTNQAMKELDTSVDGVWKKLAVGLAPVMKAIADDINSTEGKGIFGSLSQEKVSKASLQWKYMADDAVEFFEQSERAGDKFREYLAGGGPLAGKTTLSDVLGEFAGEGGGAKDRALAAYDEHQAKIKRTAQEMEKAGEKAKALADHAKRAAENLKLMAAGGEGVGKGLDKAFATAKPFMETGPLDKFKSKLAEIESAFANSPVSADQYAMAIGRLVKEFEKLNAVAEGPAFLDQGTSEAFAAMGRFQREAQARGSADPQQKVVEVLNALKRDQAQLLREGQDVARMLKKLGLLN